MKTQLFVCFLLFALVPFVFGEGQVILDEIRSVKSDLVTFLDPLFTNYGVIDDLVTDSFAATRQFELKVGVADTYLTSQQGLTSFEASLGALISSKNGDVSFQAESDIAMQASVFHFNALDLVSFEARHDMSFDSLYATSFIGGNIRAQATNSMIFGTDGEIDFNAGSDLNLNTHNSLSLFGDDVAMEAANGDIYLLAGAEFSLITEQLIIDGIHSVSVEAAGSLDFNAQSEVYFYVSTLDAFVDHNIVFDFDEILVTSPDSAVFASSNIELDSDTSITVSGTYPESVISLDFLSFLNITAASTVNFKTTGEGAPVTLVSRHDFDFFIADATTFTTPGSLTAGHNKTDTFTITAPTYTLVSDYTNHRSENELLVTASNQLLLDASHIIFNGNGVKTISTTGQINSDSRDLYVITTPNSQTGSIISSGGNTAFTSKSLTVSGFAVDGNIQQTQTYTVGALNINSNDGTNFDTTLKANSGDLALQVEDDIDISSSNFIITASDSIDFTLLDYTLTADLYGLRTNTFSIQSTNDLSFTSGFNIAIEGDDMTLTSDSASTYRSQGVIVVGGEDITFHAAKNLFVSASEYHIDVTALATWDLDELLTLNVFDDVYLKTSDFQLIADRRMSWTITGDWIGSYGELTFTSTDTITYDTLDNGDIHVRSGGDLSLNSDGQQTIAAGDAIDMFAQEEIRFSSGGPSTFTSLGPIDIYGSEEFYFNAESAFSVTATDTATYNADIITQHSDTILSLHSSGDIDVTTGNYHIEANQDAIITADSNLNMITLDNSAENLLEFDSPNFLFTASGALTIRSSLNIDLASQDSIIQSTNSLFKTDVSTDMAFDVGSLGITAGTTVTSKSTLLTSYVAGYDDFVHFNANDRFLVTGALTTGLVFDSETSILYQAKTSIDTLLDLDITLTSGDTTTIDANGILNVNAHDDLFIQSAEDLSLATINDKNVLITVGGDAKYTAGRDVNIIANGLDPLVSLNCSISVTTNDGDATFTSEAGKLELNSWKTFEIRSYDTEVGTDGNIAIDSSGSMFWESYESGIIYIVDEPDADGFLVTTERTYDGNQEYLSTLAGVKYLGYQGFEWTSADLRVWAQNGITIISNDTSAPLVTPAIHFDVGSAITSGARGLTVVAGLEAPIINEDYLLTTGNNLFIESQDLLSFFSLSTASLTAGTGDVVFTTYEGNTIDFSVGGNLISTAKNSIEFSTEDGDQYYNSNSKSFISNASGQVSIFTNDGPIELDSLGGQFNLLGADLEFESNMDTKITSLAFIQITAGDSLQLVGQDENKSGVLIKNQRDIDNIYINGNYISGAITQIQDLSNLEYTNLETQVLGDNIDIITGGSATFDSEGDSIFIGTDSLPLVKMTAAAPPGGDGPAGDAIYVEAEDTILLSSANTITSVSNSVNFGAVEFNILSTGFIYLQTQTDDVTFEATLGDINVISELITTTVIGSHTISGTAVGSGFILLSSDGQDFGDRLEFDVSTSVTVADGSALFSTGNLFDLDIGGDLQISTDTFKIANNLGFDPTYVLPYYNFISYERQSISLDFDTLESTITNELSFKVGIDTTNVPPLFNTPELYIETTVYNLDTVDFSVSNNNLDSNVQYGSVKATSFGVTGDSTFATLEDAAIYSIGNAQYIITGDAGLQFSTDSIYKIGGDTTFNLATSWNIIANGATGSQAVEFSSSENLLTAQSTTFTITNSVSPLGDPQYFDVEGGNILLTNGAGIFTIDGKANSKLISFYGEFSSSAAPLTITANDLLYNATATTSSLVFATQADMTITTPLGKFISSEYLSVHSDAATDITASVSANVHTQGGDINILGDDTITFLPTASASFDAYGYQPDNNRAVTIDAGGIITFNPTETLTIATETTQTHYSASVALTSPIMSFTTTNYESPITLLIDNGNSQITGTSTIIEGGRSAQFNAANGITVTAAGAPVRLSTNFRRNGILFDTDLKQNFHASTTFTSTGTTTADAQDIRFLIDRARGDLGVVQFKSTTSTNLRSTLGTDRPISFLSTAGNIEMAASTSLVATADYFEFTGENQQITGAAGTTLNIDSDYGQIKSLTGDIYGNAGTSAAGWSITTAAGGSVTATTDGFGDNNDILLTSPSGILLDANAAINIFGNNGDAAVIIESYTPNTGSISFTSSGNDMVVDSLSGIQFVFSGHGTENPNGILFTVADDLFVTTWEKRGSIYFQSDSDVVMSASQTIRHTEIAARLGFFSVTPAHIFTVGLQSTEGCVQSGFCGTAPGDSDDVSGSIGYFGNRVTTLQQILRQYGLIDWTQFMRP